MMLSRDPSEGMQWKQNGVHNPEPIAICGIGKKTRVSKDTIHVGVPADADRLTDRLAD
jgi:hypothetical protein